VRYTFFLAGRHKPNKHLRWLPKESQAININGEPTHRKPQKWHKKWPQERPANNVVVKNKPQRGWAAALHHRQLPDAIKNSFATCGAMSRPLRATYIYIYIYISHVPAMGTHVSSTSSWPLFLGCCLPPSCLVFRFDSLPNYLNAAFDLLANLLAQFPDFSRPTQSTASWPKRLRIGLLYRHLLSRIKQQTGNQAICRGHNLLSSVVEHKFRGSSGALIICLLFMGMGTLSETCSTE